MKLLEKSKYTLVGVTLGLGLVGLTAYAATQTGTIGSLFNSISGDENGNPVSNEYRLDGKNIQDNTITNYEIDNTDDFVVNSLQVTSEPSGDNDVVTKGYLSDNYMSTIDGDLVVPGKLSVNGGDFSGDYSVALGRYTKSSGDYSVALGRYTRANGENSVSIGHYNFANGKYSMALGYYTQADGAYSTVIGKGYVGDEDYYLINDKPNSFAVGYMNSSTDTTPEFFVEDGKVSVNGDLIGGTSGTISYNDPRKDSLSLCSEIDYSTYANQTLNQFCKEQGYDSGYESYSTTDLISTSINCRYYNGSTWLTDSYESDDITDHITSLTCKSSTLNLLGDLDVTGKIKSYSTTSLDSGNTVTTKDYVDSKISGATFYTYVLDGTTCLSGDTLIAYKQESVTCSNSVATQPSCSSSCTTGGTNWISSSSPVKTCTYYTVSYSKSKCSTNTFSPQTCSSQAKVLCQANY